MIEFIFVGKDLIFLHACVECPELPLNMSTMGLDLHHVGQAPDLGAPAGTSIDIRFNHGFNKDPA